MNQIIDMESTVKDSFIQYAGAVIQSRALVDVRDCVKPSARQVYYSMFTDKFVHERPFQKTLKSIGSAMRFYIHGDASCAGIIMRSGQPFAMRYPIVEVEGSFGNMIDSGNWAAPRYTGSRLSELANYLLKDTQTYSVDEWIDNYDDTEQYPRVLASTGFYNIVNGSTGIAVGMCGSIPQFNLTEVNEALITLLKNPDADYDDIYCAPDFATGGTIINADEVKKSIAKGEGKPCIIRAKYEYDKKNRAIIITELPYNVYTNTICTEIDKLCSNDPTIGVVGMNDLTGENVCIKLYLDKKSDPDTVMDFLYANTSLQKSFTISMTMLENGRFPKVFGWKDCLLAHLEHEKEIYVKCYLHEKEQLEHRIKIIAGILKAIDNLEKVIETIKGAESTKAANESLCSLLEIDTEQAAAILDIKLARLAKLETAKFVKEKEELGARVEDIQKILDSDSLLKKEMIKRFREVSKKFGDERRTVIKQLNTTAKVKTAKEKPNEDVVITFNPEGGYVQKFLTKDFKKSEYSAFHCKDNDLFLMFSDKGRTFRLRAGEINFSGSGRGIAIRTILKLDDDEKIMLACPNRSCKKRPYILFCFENGKVKKSDREIYIGTTRNVSGMKGSNVPSKVVNICLSNGDIIHLTSETKEIYFKADEVSPTGRTSSGVIGMKLKEGETIIGAEVLAPENIDASLIQPRGKVGRKLS